jgi:ferric-dicitrate binding protein FerR (iron transport regulator)
MDEQLIQQAVDWYVRMHDGPPGAATRAQFTDWLLLSAEHIRAFLQVTQSIEPLSKVGGDYDRERLVASAAADRSGANVITLERPRVLSEDSSSISRTQRVWLACIAGGTLGVGLLCGWLACRIL